MYYSLTLTEKHNYYNIRHKWLSFVLKIRNLRLIEPDFDGSRELDNMYKSRRIRIKDINDVRMDAKNASDQELMDFLFHKGDKN